MSTDQNIASHLVTMAQQQPSTDALLSNPRRDSNGIILYTHTTFHQLNDLSDAYARGLASHHITAGTRAALLLRPGVDFFAVTFALFKLGAIPVLIDPGIGLKNFGQCLAQAQPAAFIGIPLAHLLRRLFRWSKSTIKTNITTGHFGGIPLNKLAHTPSQIFNSANPTRAQSHLASNPIHNSSFIIHNSAAILFTSGSTGPAKGVLYTHENFNAQIQALKQLYNIQPGEIDLATFPLFALFGPALGMTTVLPDMDFTRPGFVYPPNILDPIQQLHITNMFGSPALIHRVGLFGQHHHIRLPSLKRVISAGAPASAPSLERFAQMLHPDTPIFTPYGATEALPVASIGHHEILQHTRHLTDTGHGVCVGTPAPNIRVRIIKITDSPIEAWSDSLELPPGPIGEILVQGPVVTQEYFQNPKATSLAKIPLSPSLLIPHCSLLAHRMGDCGYLDPQGRLWFVGRKSQRVQLEATADRPPITLFSIPVEAIFNTYPAVARSALVGITRNGITIPIICIELENKIKNTKLQIKTITDDLLALVQKHPGTNLIRHILYHPRFPVDIRHNAKINREQLTHWAQTKFR